MSLSLNQLRLLIWSGSNAWYATQYTLINGSVLLQEGRQYTQSVNLDDYFSMRSFMTYGFPIMAIKRNMNLHANYCYSYTPGMYNSEMYYSHNHIVGAGLTQACNKSENVDFTLSSKTDYITASSSATTGEHNSYISLKTELFLIFPYDIVFRTVASQYYYWNDTAESESFVMLNLELGEKFLESSK